MSRYIDADASLEEINEAFPILTIFNNIEAVSIRERLYTFPTADAVEVRHGEWVPYLSPISINRDLYYKCSICGTKDPYHHTTRPHANYCPNCGAKMDGERREE